MKNLFDKSGIYYNLMYKNKNYSKEANFVSNLLKDININCKSILELG